MVVVAENEHFRIVAEDEIALVIDPSAKPADGEAVVAGEFRTGGEGRAEDFEIARNMDISSQNLNGAGGDDRDRLTGA